MQRQTRRGEQHLHCDSEHGNPRAHPMPQSHNESVTSSQGTGNSATKKKSFRHFEEDVHPSVQAGSDQGEGMLVSVEIDSIDDNTQGEECSKEEFRTIEASLRPVLRTTADGPLRMVRQLQGLRRFDCFRITGFVFKTICNFRLFTLSRCFITVQVDKVQKRTPAKRGSDIGSVSRSSTLASPEGRANLFGEWLSGLVGPDAVLIRYFTDGLGSQGSRLGQIMPGTAVCMTISSSASCKRVVRVRGPQALREATEYSSKGQCQWNRQSSPERVPVLRLVSCCSVDGVARRIRIPKRETGSR